MIQTPSFYANSTGWLHSNRFYKIYIANGLLCGAVVAGSVTGKEKTPIILDSFGQGGLIGFIIGLIVVFYVHALLGQVQKFALRKREKKEAFYDGLGLDNGAFLSNDTHNFRFEAHQIQRAVFIKKYPWSSDRFTHPFPSATFLHLYLTNGSKQDFTLQEITDPTPIIEWVRGITPNVEIIEKGRLIVH